ncbi:LysM peptidoglycan-binding domain-containing protein [Alteribacter lacisalsi]|nr:LysM peptidoglycan-binding domain-containing protein [Alteribacter lacisalsi]
MNGLKLAIAAFVVTGFVGILAAGGPLACACEDVLNAKPGDLFEPVAEKSGLSEISAITAAGVWTERVIDSREESLLPFESTEAVNHIEEEVFTGVYAVQEGDTISDIAMKFDTTVAELKRRNQLANHLIYPGQIVAVPGAETK